MNALCFKFRIYPTPAQESTLADTLHTCRDVYNSLVLWRIHDFETLGTSPSRFEQQKAFPEWAKQHPELKAVHSQVLQNVAVRVDLAFNAFFQRVAAGETPGHPRFKGEGYDSFIYPQSGFSIGEHTIHLSKIGDVKAILHREVLGNVKTCTVRRHNGKWFACFSCEVDPDPLPESEEAVGIDVGLKSFAALSNGEFIQNPRFFRRDEKALTKAQRKADIFRHARNREQKAKRRKANKVVARIHERIANRRHNFVHQFARRLVNSFGLIAVEKLSVENLMATPAPKQDEETGKYLPNGATAKAGLNKSIGDAAWSMFRNVLTQKAESAGRRVVSIDPRYTSQDCCGCGYRVKKKLSERRHDCPMCGVSLDRDTNAAINILNTATGLRSVVGIPA
jgi:putative transposase